MGFSLFSSQYTHKQCHTHTQTHRYIMDTYMLTHTCVHTHNCMHTSTHTIHPHSTLAHVHTLTSCTHPHTYSHVCALTQTCSHAHTPSYRLIETRRCRACCSPTIQQRESATHSGEEGDPQQSVNGPGLCVWRIGHADAAGPGDPRGPCHASPPLSLIHPPSPTLAEN